MPVDPNLRHPVTMANGDVWPHTYFLKNCIDHPNIEIGDYSYYNDFGEPITDMRQRLVPYMHAYAPEKLVIGKFVQIAHGTQIITSSANHQMSGVSSYPFAVFGEEWADNYRPEFPNKGDTCIGHDAWLGHQSLIMPAVTIGEGAIVASRAVVTKDVPPYAIVAGNPARVVRMRFDDATIARLLALSWWHWPVALISQHVGLIVSTDIDALESIHFGQCQ